MRIVILGLSISSSWGNGHAATYRALVHGLADLGFDVLFLERDVPRYAQNRDLPSPDTCLLRLYRSVEELADLYSADIQMADAVIVGSYVPQGVAVGDLVIQKARGVAAFYDIDTPVTLSKLKKHDHEYLAPEQIARYNLYLSFTGGPALNRLKETYGSPMAVPLYCCADTETHRPVEMPNRWLMGYLGTYSADRQPALQELLIAPAISLPKKAFAVAGPEYPADIRWPDNVQRFDHLPPEKHGEFFCAQELTLNVTRAEMVKMGYCPSVRLFEAAACGTPILSDCWPGIETFFEPGKEILLARSTQEAIAHLKETNPEKLHWIGHSARKRVLAEHSARHRAIELRQHLEKARAAKRFHLFTSAAPAATARGQE